MAPVSRMSSTTIAVRSEVAAEVAVLDAVGGAAFVDPGGHVQPSWARERLGARDRSAVGATTTASTADARLAQRGRQDRRAGQRVDVAAEQAQRGVAVGVDGEDVVDAGRPQGAAEPGDREAGAVLEAVLARVGEVRQHRVHPRRPLAHQGVAEQQKLDELRLRRGRGPDDDAVPACDRGGETDVQLAVVEALDPERAGLGAGAGGFQHGRASGQGEDDRAAGHGPTPAGAPARWRVNQSALSSVDARERAGLLEQVRGAGHDGELVRGSAAARRPGG